MSSVYNVLLIEPNNNYYSRKDMVKAMGGSETVFVFMKEAFENHLNCNVQTLFSEDITPENLVEVNKINYDLIISYRNPSIFITIQGKINACLFQDMPNPMCLQQISQLINTGRLNRLIFLSHFQKEAYLNQLPRELITEARHCYMFENGLDMSLFSPNILKENNFIYASAPNRGLKELLEIWPILYQCLPDWKLKIAGGVDMYQIPSNDPLVNQERQEFLSIGNELYNKAKEMDGIEYLGALSHAELIKEFEKSKVFLYPNTFPETCCHVLNIALQAGCCPVVSRMGALVEKVISGENGFIVEGDPSSDQFKQNTIETIMRNIQSIERICKTNKGSYLGYDINRLVDRLVSIFMEHEKNEGNNHRIYAVCPSLYGNNKRNFSNWKWYSPIDIQTDELIGLPIDQARDAAAHCAVKREADWLLFIDDDIYTEPYFPMDILKTALKRNVDVVVCNYYFKEDYDLVPVARVYRKSDMMVIDITDLLEEEINGPDYQFVMAGLGACLISTKALAKIGRPYFRTQNVQIRHTGEDSFFFQECRRLGIPVWLSVDIPLVHVSKNKIYGRPSDIDKVVPTLLSRI